jgi:hypothetical protein
MHDVMSIVNDHIREEIIEMEDRYCMETIEFIVQNQKDIDSMLPPWRKFLLSIDAHLATMSAYLARPYRYLMDNIITNTSVMSKTDQ